jgi:hypothetical protein
MSFPIFFFFLCIITSLIWWCNNRLRHQILFWADNKLLKISLLLLFFIQIYNRINIVFLHHLDTVSNDNNIIYGVQRILSNENLYQNPNNAPFSIIQYTPFYYYIAAACANIFGIAHDEVQQLFIVCRSLNLVLNLLALAVFWQITRLFRFDFLQKLLATTFVFSLLHVQYWARCDSLYLLFFVATIYASLVYFFENKTPKSTILLAFSVGILSAFAAFSKQNLPFPLLIFGLFALFQKRFLGIIYAGLGFLITAFGLYFCFTQYTTWFIFYQNTVLGLNSYLRFPGFLLRPYTESLPFWTFLSSGIVFSWFFIQQQKQFSEKAVYLATALGTTAALTFFTIFKAGSGPNYFNDFYVFWILAAVFYYNRKSKKLLKPHTISSAFWATFFGFIFVFVLFRSSSLFFNLKMANEPFQLKDDIQTFENQQLTANYLKTKLKKEEYVFTTKLDFFGNFLPKNTLFPQKDIVHTQSHYDFSLFQKTGNQGLIRFLVLTPQDTFPPVYLGLRLDNFRLDTVINGAYRVYEKK